MKQLKLYVLLLRISNEDRESLVEILNDLSLPYKEKKELNGIIENVDEHLRIDKILEEK